MVDTGGGTKQKAFKGQGNRLGTGNEPRSYQSVTAPEPLPAPAVDPNVSSADRDRIRAERAAAAEARLKATGVDPKKKKKKTNDPIRGPNSEPLMRWS